MKNCEYYVNDIALLMSNGTFDWFKKKTGYNGSFEFDDLLDWLNEEHVEKIELTVLEHEMLKEVLKNGYVFIARDKHDSLYIYRDKPFKDYDIWRGEYATLLPFINLFRFIKWEDEEPVNIQELLDNCEAIVNAQ